MIEKKHVSMPYRTRISELQVTVKPLSKRFQIFEVKPIGHEVSRGLRTSRGFQGTSRGFNGSQGELGEFQGISWSLRDVSTCFRRILGGLSELR